MESTAFSKPLKSLSVVIPAYNERNRILVTLRKLRTYLDAHASEYEVLVVDDGSKDDTSTVVAGEISGWSNARLITLSKNVGKGGAVRAGVLAATKENLCFMDADCSTDLEMFPRMFALLNAQTSVIIGSRDVKGAEVVVHQNFLREYSAKFFNLWIQAWLLPGVWDTQCGFKMFRTDVARKIFEPLIEQRFAFDVEILYRARKLGCSIVECPVRWSNVADSRVSPLRDGIAMAWQVVKIRFMA
ncbi:MAG: glycosyltransferase family 2 protein [Deltaproteobacteria bacterium]|nr:glycosyltransferase family 2 protein [Deltaproteobacteria bacterium]